MAAARASTLVCDVGVLAPDAAAVDALARLQLDARRRGYEVVLRGASSQLLELLDLCGVRGVLRLEPGGKPEQREERVGIEEEREADDAAP
jgi:ABC-type transporter Mla MlaB component